jgi:hypothetical protein
MRPDKKKTRHHESQKKAAAAKKKIAAAAEKKSGGVGGGGAAGGGGGGGEGEKKKSEPTPFGAAAASATANSDTDSESEGTTSGGAAYSKRNISSNWTKYEIPSSGDEGGRLNSDGEEDPNTGDDYNEVLANAGDGRGHMAQIQTWRLGLKNK